MLGWLIVSLILLTPLVLLVAAVWFCTAMPGPRHRGPISAVTDEERQLADRLRAHVTALADRIGPRPATHGPKTEETLAFLEAEWRAQGYASRRDADLNLEIELPGGGPGLLVVGAHYDTRPETPGADDNSSAVAALLELSRSLQGRRLGKTVRMVAFADEERGLRGSAAYARRLKEAGTRVDAMISLEMLGYYRDEPGSQRYPLSFLGYLYPDRGDFLAAVANPPSRSLLRRVVGLYRETVAMPCEGMVAPEALRHIGRSDNRSFWVQGYPAIMLTDTSNFRNPHYHGPGDRPDTLDYLRLARVTAALPKVVEHLCQSSTVSARGPKGEQTQQQGD